MSRKERLIKELSKNKFTTKEFIILILISIIILFGVTIGTCQTTVHYSNGITSYAKHIGDPEKKKKSVKKKKKSKARKNTIPTKRKHYSCKKLHRKVKRGRSLTH